MAAAAPDLRWTLAAPDAVAILRRQLAVAGRSLQDPAGAALAQAVRWWPVSSAEVNGGRAVQTPVVDLGDGPPLLLLHGFDSCFLEFRRLAPALRQQGYRLIIPDLYGFGFCERPAHSDFTPALVVEHLAALLQQLDGPVSLIGASMGGAVAVALARRCPDAIKALLLLSPAGLTGRPMPLPPGLDRIGVVLLAQQWVRNRLCRQAFADPDRLVNEAALEIASLHLRAPGWAEALRRFSRSGGYAGNGAPLPGQPLRALWGCQDRILRPPQRRAAMALLGDRLELVEQCGHLPHLEQVPRVVAALMALLPMGAG